MYLYYFKSGSWLIFKFFLIIQISLPGAKFSPERNDKIILKRKSGPVYTEMTELNWDMIFKK